MKKISLIILVVIFLSCIGCQNDPQSISGTKMVMVEKVQTTPAGKTIEQSNITDRIKMDNTPGSIKHLYVISAYSGQVIIYSTVKGKVTSSDKRLTPSTVDGSNTFDLHIGGTLYGTRQILGEDGTYGHSAEYLYWWDSKGIYHQHYVSGGQILHISDQPLSVKGVIINMEIR